MSGGSKPYARTAILDIWSPDALERAVTLVQKGEPVCFPTDTVYGIGVHAYQPAAVERLYELKGRPARLAIPLLLPDAEAMRTACAEIPAVAWRLAARFWPGGLSLVLRRSPVAGVALMFGALAIGGMPPMAVFLSEFSILRGGLADQRYVATVLLATGIVVAFFGIMRHVNHMVFGADAAVTGGSSPQGGRSLPPSCRLTLLLGAIPVLVLGVWLPSPLYALVQQAAQTLVP